MSSDSLPFSRSTVGWYRAVHSICWPGCRLGRHGSTGCGLSALSEGARLSWYRFGTVDDSLTFSDLRVAFTDQALAIDHLALIAKDLTSSAQGLTFRDEFFATGHHVPLLFKQAGLCNKAFAFRARHAGGAGVRRSITADKQGNGARSGEKQMSQHSGSFR
jgi:hypothetical protein